MGIILENVKVSYVQLLEPKENLSGNLAYSCCILVDKEDKSNLARIDAAIQKAIMKGKSSIWGGKKPSFRYQPKRDGDAELESGDREGDEYKNVFFINPSMQAKRGKPGVVDENLQPILDIDKIYSGCFCNVEVNPFPFKNSGNCGVGWGLNNVMFVEDGDRLDGRRSAASAFANLAPQTPEETGDAENF